MWFITVLIKIENYLEHQYISVGAYPLMWTPHGEGLYTKMCR